MTSRLEYQVKSVLVVFGRLESVKDQVEVFVE
jgi:hypothetical protein